MLKKLIGQPKAHTCSLLVWAFSVHWLWSLKSQSSTEHMGRITMYLSSAHYTSTYRCCSLCLFNCN